MPTEAELRPHHCCFTGHRPEKLGMSEDDVIARLEKAILAAIQDGYTTFISGMARGVDIWAAEIVLKLRDAGQPIKLICASPFDGFESSWKSEWRTRYKTVIETADLTKFICNNYSRTCFQTRNEWMVDHSARVIAVYNGQSGGTQNTIVYANRHSVDVKNVFEMNEELEDYHDCKL